MYMLPLDYLMIITWLIIIKTLNHILRNYHDLPVIDDVNIPPNNRYPNVSIYPPTQANNITTYLK